MDGIAGTSLLNIILMEDQSPHLDTLPRLLIFRPRNRKSRMRDPFRPILILLRALYSRSIVKTLKHQDLVRCLMVLIEPLVRFAMLHGERRPRSITFGVDDWDGD